MEIMRLLTLLILLIPVNQTSDPPLPFESLNVGVNFIEFNIEMTFGEAAMVLGSSEIHRKGDAGGSLKWTCYLCVAESDSAILLLESTEMGGPDGLTSFEIVRPNTLPDMEQGCVLIDVPPPSIITDRGIHLGMSRTDVERILGIPTEDVNDVVMYSIFAERRGLFGRRVQIYTACSALRLWYENDVVTRMWGNRIDVN